MRILMAHNMYRSRGGEDIVFETEKRLLERKGHNLVVYERHNDEINGFSVWRRAGLSRRTIWATDSADAIRRILVQHKTQVAYFHNTFPLISPAAYHACAAEGVPVVQTLSNYRLTCPGANLLRNGRICELCLGKKIAWQGVRHSCYRNSAAQSAVVAAMLLFHHLAGTWKSTVHAYIALTEFSRRKFIEAGLPAEKIVVKPNFLDPDPGPRTHDSGYALFVGRLAEEKGISTLLQAWRSLSEVPLKVAGDGPRMSLVDQAAGKSGSAEIEALGWLTRDEVLRYLSRASFLVIPSLAYEAFPLTIVEAFACGVPVIGSRLGGVSEIVRHDQSGLLFEPGNASALADAVNRLWSDPPLRVRLSKGARAQFEALYTAERNHGVLMEILGNAVASKNRLHPPLLE